MSQGIQAILDSGRLLVEQDPQSRVACFQFLFKSGSLAERSDLPGSALFTARALLRGTRLRSHRALTQEIERLGGSLSAHVDQEVTVLRGAVLVQNIVPFLKLMREILSEPAFEASEVEILRATLIGELRSSMQDPQELAARALLATAYRGTHAENPPNGTRVGLSKVDSQDLRDHFSASYHLSHLWISCVSPFSGQQMRDLLLESLVNLPDGIARATQLPSLTTREFEVVIVDRKGLATTPVFAAVPGVGDAHPDLPALEVGNFAFGEDFTSRLMQVLRAQNGWTYGVSSGYSQLIASKATPSFFSIYLYPSSEHAAVAIKKTIEMLRDYAASGLSSEEFAQSCESLINAYPFQLATAEQRLALRVREGITGRKQEGFEEFSKRMRELTVQGLNALIKRHTLLSCLTVVAVGDAETLSPVLKALPGNPCVSVLDPEVFLQSSD